MKYILYNAYGNLDKYSNSNNDTVLHVIKDYI